MKTVKEILACAPELDGKDVAELNEEYVPYMFFKNDDRQGVQHCSCSRCRQSFDVPYVARTRTPAESKFLKSGHNERVVCPRCGGEMVKKHKGISKNCRRLFEYQRAVYIKRASFNEVYLLYVWSTKKYNKGDSVPGHLDYLTLPDYEINAVYYLTPTEQRCIIQNAWTGRWEEKSIREPFIKNWIYNFTSYKRGYTVFGLDELRNSFLRYFDFERMANAYKQGDNDYYTHYWSWHIYEFPFCKALSRFAKYPSLEWLLKQGYDDFVYFMIKDGRESPSLFDWDAKSPFSFFKTLSVPEIKQLKSLGLLQRHALPEYRYWKRREPKISPEEYKRLIDIIPADRLSDFKEVYSEYKIKVNEILKYFKGKNAEENCRYWLDYIGMAKTISFDLNVHNVLFPKNLRKAHNNAGKITNEIKEEEDRKRLRDLKNKYAKRYKRLKEMYCFEEGNYKVVVPEGMTQIVNEGKALSHCVGGYAERHINGKTTILFIREIEHSDVPLLTVEIRDKDFHILQVHGKRNRNPKPEEKAFIDKWHEEIISRKSKKNKKAAEAA